MRKDNFFYREPKVSVYETGERGCPESASYDELYEIWLLPHLLTRPPIKLYHKSLVDFAELVLEDADSRIDWFRSSGDFCVKTILGHSLKTADQAAEVREFSVVAMEYAGYKYEFDLYEWNNPFEADAMCNHLIEYLNLVPKYFRYVDTVDGTILKGTKKLRQESGLRVWLDSVVI